MTSLSSAPNSRVSLVLALVVSFGTLALKSIDIAKVALAPIKVATRLCLVPTLIVEELEDTQTQLKEVLATSEGLKQKLAAQEEKLQASASAQDSFSSQVEELQTIKERLAHTHIWRRRSWKTCCVVRCAKKARKTKLFVKVRRIGSFRQFCKVSTVTGVLKVFCIKR